MSTDQIGIQIFTIDGIVAKADKHQAVYVTDFRRAVSAAFLVQMRVATLAKFIKSGCYTYYKKNHHAKRTN